MGSGSRAYFVVDVFTDQPFAGNAAAVVTDARRLTDERMQAIAAEFNLSETTFVLPVDSRPSNPGDTSSAGGNKDAGGRSGGNGLTERNVGQGDNGGSGGANREAGRARVGDEENLGAGVRNDAGRGSAFRFRWFTPTVAVAMCGHATIAGVHALVEQGLIDAPADEASSTVVSIETHSGRLTAFVELVPGGSGDRMIWLELLPPVLSPLTVDRDELADVLNLARDAFDGSLPMERTQDDDGLVFVRDFMALNDVRPDFRRLGTLLSRVGLRGMSLATTKTVTPSVHVQSRFFCPPCGIDEDPVTGSVHGPLAAYLVKHGRVPLVDGMAGMNAVQGIPGGRTGLLHALVRPGDDGGYTVRIGGRAVTVMRGVLFP
jgi:trans-2,3-dihydro-3-hydroxyanthranilate isomerase